MGGDPAVAGSVWMSVMWGLVSGVDTTQSPTGGSRPSHGHRERGMTDVTLAPVTDDFRRRATFTLQTARQG